MLDGGYGDDVLIGGAGDDILNGFWGVDTAVYSDARVGVRVDLRIETAQDTGWGNDTLTTIRNLEGSAYDDVLTGSHWFNRLVGGRGHDTLLGMGGDDFLVGGAGNDLLDGGDGYDVADYRDSTGAVTVDLATTAPQNTGVSGVDTLRKFEAVIGSRFADTLTGDATENYLEGGAGNDRLNGGRGSDQLLGGAGADRFYFTSPLNGDVDNIRDFSAVDDAIYLDRTVFQGLSGGTLSASAFTTNNVLDADDRIRYDPSSGTVYFDRDGSGPSATFMFANIGPNAVVTAADFVVF